jgi:hypothetical protein
MTLGMANTPPSDTVGKQAGQSADDYRGGWETYGNTPLQVLEFSIRGAQVRGIFCTRCSDATTLAFVDGSFGPHGLTFVVTHVHDDGSTAYVDHATAQLQGKRLWVTGTSGAPGGKSFQYWMRKDPRGPAPLPGTQVARLPPGPLVPPVVFPAQHAPVRIPPGIWANRICQYLDPRHCSYVPPGRWELLSPDKVVGVWLGFRVGPGKQFFIIRRVGSRLRGMVCGECDNPYTMAALDDFQIQGDTLQFNILHEDWGPPGSMPFHNQVMAHVADNEMRIQFVSNRASTRAGRPNGAGGASLFGPIPIEATRGNQSSSP